MGMTFVTCDNIADIVYTSFIFIFHEIQVNYF